MKMNLFLYMKGGIVIRIIYKGISLIFIIIIFNVIYKVFGNNKENYIKNININNKFNNLSFVKKIQFYINYLSIINNNIYTYINPITIIFISSILLILTIIFSYNFFHIISSSILLGIYSFFIPYLVLTYKYNSYRKKIINIFPSYIISLKNYTQTTNDIIIAIKKVSVEEPLNTLINKFNILIEKGVTVYDALERLKSDINIKKINEFFSAVQSCYINGGDFSQLLDKYSKILNKINLQREKEIQDNFSSILVLIILSIINVFLIVSFVYSNTVYKNIITGTIAGRIILNINIISYFLVFLFIKKLNQVEE